MLAQTVLQTAVGIFATYINITQPLLSDDGNCLTQLRNLMEPV